jgi:hypothetical protein
MHFRSIPAKRLPEAIGTKSSRIPSSGRRDGFTPFYICVIGSTTKNETVPDDGRGVDAARHGNVNISLTVDGRLPPLTSPPAGMQMALPTVAAPVP